MQSKATTVRQYLNGLPADRRRIIGALRKVIRGSLDGRFAEAMQYGMIGYQVPHSIYPAGYHCDPAQPLPFICLASQKNHVSLYLGCVYLDAELGRWFRKAWAATGRKLDMGKSCIRFRRLEDAALDVIAESIRRVSLEEFIRQYEAVVVKQERKKRGTAKRRKG